MTDLSDLLLLAIAGGLAIGYTLDMVMLGTVLVWVAVYILAVLISIRMELERLGGV